MEYIEDIININIWLIGIAVFYTIWISILFWVSRDAHTRELTNRPFWTTIIFFTGPVGLGIYLFSLKESKQRCPSCGKVLKKIGTTICPHCHQKLSLDVISNIFLDQMRDFDETKFRIAGQENSNLAAIPDSPGKWTSIKAVKLIIGNAIEQGATDIHLEPEHDHLRVRYRIDGVLREVTAPPRELHGPIIPCVKAMAQIDVAERRKPLDGRMQILYGDRRTDIRVSTSPTIHGEKIALRILDQHASLLNITKLGINDEVKDQFMKKIRSTQGMILVTGPTGSGKTTTLYAALSSFDSTNNNIMTIEDPVEYQLEGITQIPINPRADVTFASGLRSILRQDPDIIMVGEIRDKETAEIAIRAALTGHLIFSTLHTNDAVGAVVRLIDIGIESYLISSAILAVLAQRLIRVICPACKINEEPSAELLEELGIPIEDKMKFYKGQGCKDCKFTGFSGRTGIFELLIIHDELRQMIDERASSVKLCEIAIKSGMIPLLYDGIAKAKLGITSLSEVASTIR